MSRVFSIHEAAEIEFNEAVDFYDLESPGLGMAFIDEIQKAFENISQYPEASPSIQGRVRRKILIKFPYSLLYSVWPNEIRILAFAHQKRRPFYWRGRRGASTVEKSGPAAGPMRGYEFYLKKVAHDSN